MKIKTADLIGPALDWAVGVAASMPIHVSKQTKFPTFNKVLCRMGDDDSTDFRAYTPSSNWSQGGPIIEREMINVKSNLARMREHPEYDWWADCPEKRICVSFNGPTPLVAAMRCYCCSKLGNEVDVPDELV